MMTARLILAIWLVLKRVDKALSQMSKSKLEDENCTAHSLDMAGAGTN